MGSEQLSRLKLKTQQSNTVLYLAGRRGAGDEWAPRQFLACFFVPLVAIWRRENSTVVGGFQQNTFLALPTYVNRHRYNFFGKTFS